MEDIQKYILSKMPRYDRLLHFFIGFIIFAICTILLSNITALIIIVVIGILKELADKYLRDSKFDLVDFIYTISSGLILTILNL